MKEMLMLVLVALVASSCASVKDENGKTVGTCIGAGCLLRAALGANTIDSKTGEMKGNIHLATIPLPASAPAATPEMSDK